MNHHLTDAALRDFAAHSLSGERVLAVDEHLAGCGECRARLVALGGVDARLFELQNDFLALESHLSEEDVQRYAGGDLDSDDRAELDRHLKACSTCAAEVRDLKEWIAARSARWRPHYLAAAAVVLTFLGAFAAGRWFSSPEVAGLDSLPDDARARVEAALAAGVAEPPESLAPPPEVLMGTTTGPPFRLLQPLGVVTVSDQPEFRWEPLSGAESYEIAVLDGEGASIESQESLTDTSWTPPAPLARGRTYVWQVTARRSGESITVPAPPSPMARFGVMDADASETIERASRENPEAHLLLGILYTLYGAPTEAEAHLSRVTPDDPHFETARRTLEQLAPP